MGGSDAELAAARDLVRTSMGAAALIDAVGVISNFERMVRIADATGIPLGNWEETSSELRDELGINDFAIWKQR